MAWRSVVFPSLQLEDRPRTASCCCLLCLCLCLCTRESGNHQDEVDCLARPTHAPTRPRSPGNFRGAIADCNGRTRAEHTAEQSIAGSQASQYSLRCGSKCCLPRGRACHLPDKKDQSKARRGRARLASSCGLMVRHHRAGARPGANDHERVSGRGWRQVRIVCSELGGACCGCGSPYLSPGPAPMDIFYRFLGSAETVVSGPETATAS